MAAGLTRSEQIAFVAVGLLIVGGVAFQHFRSANSKYNLEAPNANWHEVASSKSGDSSPENKFSKELNEIRTQTRGGSAAEPSAPLNLNSATLQDLEALPGIGPVRAKDILVAREMRKGFAHVEDLLEVPGIGEVTLEKLKPFIMIADETTTPSPSQNEGLSSAQMAADVSKAMKLPHPSAPAVQRININTATVDELLRIPGVGPAFAAKIIAARERKPFEKPEDLIEVSGIGAKTFEKMRVWVIVE